MKMKIIILIGIIFVSSVFFSACQPLEGGEMSAQVTQQTFLFDTTATSCASEFTTSTRNDLSSLYMDSLYVTLTNPAPGPSTSAGTIVIAYMEVTLYSSNLTGGQKTVQIPADELRYSWWGSGGGTLDRAVIYPGETRTNACGIKLGGIALIDKMQYTVGNGRIYIYGTTIDGSNNTVPITDAAYFNWTYNGKPR